MIQHVRIVGCGGRSLNPYKVRDWLASRLTFELDRLFGAGQWEIAVLAEGNQTGGDEGCGLYADEYLPAGRHAQIEANWLMFGNDAGPIRNRDMFNRIRPNVLIAFPGQYGTGDMLTLIEEYNSCNPPQPVHIIKPQGVFK